MTSSRVIFCFLIALAIRIVAGLAVNAPARAMETAHLEHQTIARNLANGKGFVFPFFSYEALPTSQQAPLVPGLLAGCYLAFGVESRPAFIAMLAIQIFVSSLTVVFIAKSIELVSAGTKAWIAGFILASLYPPLVISPLHFQALVWNLFGIAGLILGTLLLRDYPSRGAIWLFGVSGSVGMLADPILAGVAGVLGLYLIAVALMKSDRQLFVATMASAAIMAAAITPWTIRNYQVHGRLVFIKSSFGYVFWQGNNHLSHGTDKLPVRDEDKKALTDSIDPTAAQRSAFDIRKLAVSVDTALTESQQKEILAMTREIDRMDYFATLAWREISQNPNHYFALCGERLLSWVWFDQTNPRSFLWHYRASYLTMACLAIAGLFMGKMNLRRAYPVLLAGLALTAVHVLIITSARFRIPLELLFIFPASQVVSDLARRFFQKRSHRAERPVHVLRLAS